MTTIAPRSASARRPSPSPRPVSPLEEEGRGRHVPGHLLLLLLYGQVLWTVDPSVRGGGALSGVRQGALGALYREPTVYSAFGETVALAAGAHPPRHLLESQGHAVLPREPLESRSRGGEITAVSGWPSAAVSLPLAWARAVGYTRTRVEVALPWLPGHASLSHPVAPAAGMLGGIAPPRGATVVVVVAWET